jgi:hypothetical protein
VIQVWLSHDMQGYEGVETLVYTALARVGPPHNVSFFFFYLTDSACLDSGTSRGW